MIEDILIYLDEEDEVGYETNQHYIGIKELFRGIIVKIEKEQTLIVLSMKY